MNLEPSRQLLAAVFPHDPKYRNPDFLRWQYVDSPSGTVISADRDDEDGRLGHYAVVPQRWLQRGRPTLYALSLNTAVAERGRGRGLFTELATAAYGMAVERGVEAIVGVANANSTPGFLGKLAFENAGPLQVVVTPARPTRRRPTIVDPQELESDPIVLAQSEHTDTRRRWDPEELRWRLQAPGADYIVVRVDDAVVIAHATTMSGVRFAAILKVLTQPSGGPADAGRVVGHVCRAIRAPLAVYAGFNPDFHLRGVPVPMRFRPSPLNLIVRSAVGTDDPAEYRPDCFEFLDFDAY